ncbi:MAG: phosphate ABC transporter substrate-binding protein PstS [bacterium]|nr:phosphate ABC transporter substrate-binding protein PstS [bacterium]
MRSRQIQAFFLLVACVSLLTGCDVKSDSSAGSAGGLVRLQGAGASFPAPLYNKWFKDYTVSHDGVQIDYQSVGSGSGVKSVIDGTVDFGASDAAMKPEEMAKVPQGVQLLPLTAGAVVIAYNLEGVSGLKLSREAYTAIFLGGIKMWNDPLIAASNPGLDLPNKPINVVTRSDSSGTSFVFTQHLSEISADFASQIGVNKMPSWGVGTGAKGNEGVTGALKTTPGSIGYVEYGYAANLGLEMASLENASGNFVVPSIESAKVALASQELPPNLIAWMPDPPGKDAYPIVTFTWLICYKQYADPDKVSVLKDVITYCLEEGQSNSEQLGYVPLPETVVSQVKAALDNIK